MISFELNGSNEIVEKGISLPNNIFFEDGVTGIMKNHKLKIYLNGKLLRKKIIIDKHGWRLVKPLKLTNKDTLKYFWEV